MMVKSTNDPHMHTTQCASSAARAAFVAEASAPNMITTQTPAGPQECIQLPDATMTFPQVQGTPLWTSDVTRQNGILEFKPTHKAVLSATVSSDCDVDGITFAFTSTNSDAWLTSAVSGGVVNVPVQFNGRVPEGGLEGNSAFELRDSFAGSCEVTFSAASLCRPVRKGRCGGWHLANYDNHVVGETPNYAGTQYGLMGTNSGGYANFFSSPQLSCPETCALLGPGYESAGARYVCNWYPGCDAGGGCWNPLMWNSETEQREGTCTAEQAPGPDGTDFPPGTPGGHNAHCDTMAYDVDGDGTVRCTTSLRGVGAVLAPAHCA